MLSNTKKNELWLTIITVTYNSSLVISNFLESIPEHEKDNVEVIIVDNNSKDDSAILAEQSTCKVIKLESNIGFGSACNKGANLANTDMLFFVNPDCQFRNNTIAEMKLGLEKHPEAAAYNPRIVNNGKPYFRRRSNLLPKSKHWKGDLPNKNSEIPILSGSSILCRRTLFDEINGFDDNIFLYYEDDDISLRFLEKGSLFMIYDAVIDHHFGHSSGRDSDTARFKGYHMEKSWAYSAHKHGIQWSSKKQKAKLLLSLLLPHIAFNKRRRAKYLGMLRAINEISVSY